MIYKIIALIGLPTILSAITIVCRWVISLQKGVQALLRQQLYQEYNKWIEREYCPLWAKENFNNMYNQYHNLGKNGVMDGIALEIKSLPTERKKDEVK